MQPSPPTISRAFYLPQPKLCPHEALILYHSSLLAPLIFFSCLSLLKIYSYHVDFIHYKVVHRMDISQFIHFNIDGYLGHFSLYLLQTVLKKTPQTMYLSSCAHILRNWCVDGLEFQWLNYGASPIFNMPKSCQFTPQSCPSDFYSHQSCMKIHDSQPRLQHLLV